MINRRNFFKSIPLVAAVMAVVPKALSRPKGFLTDAQARELTENTKKLAEHIRATDQMISQINADIKRFREVKRRISFHSKSRSLDEVKNG